MKSEVFDEVVLNSRDGDIDDALGNPTSDRGVDDPLEDAHARGGGGGGGAGKAETTGSVATAHKFGDWWNFWMNNSFAA